MEMFTNSMVSLVSKAPRRLFSSLTLFLLLILSLAHAQPNPLNRHISIDLDHKRLDDALDRVGKKGQFTFSYRTDLLPADSLVTVHVQEATVRKVTEQLLGPHYSCKPVGNHVVIRRANEPLIPEAPSAFHLEGFLIDANTGEKIRFATVYDNASRLNALSDPQGHYALTLPGQQHQAELNISRRGYFDTLIVIDPSRVSKLTVGLRPYPYANQPLASREPDLLEDRNLDQLPLAEWLVGQDRLMLTDNVVGMLHKFPFQISFVPHFGTNRNLSGAMENNFSLNILAGYSNGVNGVEIGGLVNIDRENVRGLQIAGLADVVGGNVHGLQAGGIMNHVRGSLHGLQVGGILNHVHGDVSGLQVGGIMNHVEGTVTGLQIAGIYNHTPHSVKGMQIAGIANYSPGDVSHVQISGIANYAKGTIGGFQIGGLYNHAGMGVGGCQIGGLANYTASKVGGFQISGIVNYAKGDVGGFQIGGIANVAKGEVKGFQIAGIVNKAHTVKGFQIGLINVADTMEGVCIGLLNAIKHGYKVIDLSYNDVAQANLSYKAGTRRFYNILNVGYRFGPTHFAAIYGAGFGTMQKLGPLTLSLEAAANNVVEQGLGLGALNLLVPARLSLGLSLGKHLELYGGVAHNLHVTQPHNSIGEFKSELGQNALWRQDGNNTRVQGWIGYQGGLRIQLGSDAKADKEAGKEATKESDRESIKEPRLPRGEPKPTRQPKPEKKR